MLPGYMYVTTKAVPVRIMLGAAPPIFPQRTGDKRADTIGLMQQMFDAMEEIIRQYPDTVGSVSADSGRRKMRLR